MKKQLLKQVKPMPRVGAFQVQVSTTMSHYMVYINMCLMAMMFWHTTAAPWLRQFIYAGASFWMFALFMFFIGCSIMLFDYKFVYPSRQAFINQQAFKHGNPAVALIKKIREEQEEMRVNQQKIMEKLGIDGD